MTAKRTYEQLIKLKSFDDRFNYLKLDGSVGQSTFGFDRYLNQAFYSSSEWKSLRNHIIIRDEGNDLALDGYPLDRIYIHHMNPITQEDILNRTDLLLDPNYLICVSFETHNAIHYGDSTFPDSKKILVRQPNDTCPWKH